VVTEPLEADAALPAGAGSARRRAGALLGRVAALVERNAFVVCVLAALTGIELAFLRATVTPDSWYTLLGGRVVSRAWLPRHDTLTVLTRGRDWVDQQWLAQLGLYGLWRAGGWPLALVAVTALFAAAFALVAAAARLLGASARSTALVLLLCYLVAVTNAAFRAQTPAYLLFSLVLVLLLEDERRPSRRVLLVFPLLALWANVHGSVVLGAGLVTLRGAVLALTGLRRRERPGAWLARAAGLLVAPWLCTLASPYGLSLPAYYRRVLDNPTLSGLVTEWRPATIRDAPFFFLLLAVALGLAAARARALSPLAHLALVGTAAAGLWSLRNMVWFALVAAAVVPSALDALWPPKDAPRRRALNLALAGTAVAALLAVAGAAAAHGAAWFERDYPAAAGDAVAAAAAGDPRLLVFADARYADWLLVEHPELAGRVAYDVRYELLDGRELRAIARFDDQTGAGWWRLARGYGLLVLDPGRELGAIRWYRERKHVATLYRDPRVAVLALPEGGA